MKQTDLLVIGAGAAGIMAAIKAADEGLKVAILESMPRPARKIGISGKGRGNLTNTAPYKDFLKHFNNEGRFLKTAFRSFFNTELVSFFNNEGLDTVEERGGRIFVASQKATDAVHCLHKALEKRKVALFVDTPVKELSISQKRCIGAVTRSGSQFSAHATLLATGGMSYPLTGSTGDGYEFARKCGHSIVTPLPSLVALVPTTPFPRELNGVALRNVNAELRSNGKKIAAEFGEMLFQDGNLAGPTVITLSRKAVPELVKDHSVEIVIDLKPALDHHKLDQRLLRDIDQNKSGSLEGIVARLLPDEMRQFCLQQIGLSPFLKASRISAEQRRILRNWLKEVRFKVSGPAPWSQAIVTAGGISTQEVNPVTMQSKIVENLYFAGEILDIDADTGGYNLQAAFSTGWLAAASVADKLRKSTKE